MTAPVRVDNAGPITGGASSARHLGHRRAELPEDDYLASPHIRDALGNPLPRQRLIGLLRDVHDAYRDSASRRCARCGWLVLRPFEGVKVMRRAERCHLDNVMRCGLIWECPTCGAHIKAERAREVEAARAWHLGERVKALGGTGWSEERKVQWAERTVVMVTLTLRHGFGDSVGELRRGLAHAWQRFQRSHWTDESKRLGFVGGVRAMETTWGAANGYHPHLHAMMCFQAPPPPDLERRFYEKWVAAVTAELGLDYAPLPFKIVDGTLQPLGVVVTQCNRASYLAKLGLEISAPHTKTADAAHYTPVQFLMEFMATGDTLWLHRYQEYANEMSGARQLTWLAGLKRKAGLAERTDEDLVAGETEPGDELVTVIPTPAYKVLRNVRGAVASLLELAELWGQGAADDYVQQVLANCERIRDELRQRRMTATAPPGP